MSTTTTLTSADGHRFNAYVAQPSTKPRGAVVVLQEIFGVNSHIRSVADGYAAAGYLALAPETFSRVQPGVELGYTEADMNQGFALKTAAEKQVNQVLQDIAAAVAHAAPAGKVGVVGYCWGGLMSWRAACELPGIAAAVTYYGGGMTAEAEAARTPRCPVMAHFGDQDHWIPLDTVEAFKKAQPGVQVHVYAANHGFNCDQRGSYNAAAAATARERSLAWFAQHIG
jgi:carboxymethylenebutenolidase